MKALKLDHAFAERVLQGSMATTWRLYDDKDIQVNDVIELIDKVQPTDPRTWCSIGLAAVDVVTQKRLGDVAAAEYKGYYASREDMLDAFKKYYGPHVTFDTPVKMIHFILRPRTDASEVAVTEEAKLFADGGSRGNPGPSASGFVIVDMNDKVLLKKGVYLGVTTNNQAEYQALKFGMQEARAMGVRNLHVYMDSMLVVNQMTGVFKVKNRDLWPIHDAIVQLVPAFRYISFSHVPRELNKLADAAVNEALDDVLQQQA